METITIQKHDLRKALAQWEELARAGKLRGAGESNALPLEQVADESAGFLWELLERDQLLDAPHQVLVSQEMLQTAFLMFVVSNREDQRVVREAAAQGVSVPAVSSEERVAEFGARRLWKLLGVIAHDESHAGGDFGG